MGQHDRPAEESGALLQTLEHGFEADAKRVADGPVDARVGLHGEENTRCVRLDGCVEGAVDPGQHGGLPCADSAMRSGRGCPVLALES